ncbi:uncharacterized protein KZ484_010924 [Pholidichthys leucotaenia]
MEPRREDFPQQPECKEEEVLTEQQLWNQEKNSVLEDEPEPSQVKEEQEELCISQEGEQPAVKLEADTFMVTLISEEKQQNEAEPNSEQLLSHTSAVTEIRDEEGSRHVDLGSRKEEEESQPKKRRLKTESHNNKDDNSLTSKTLCENETDAPQLHDCKEEEVLTFQQLCNQERNSRLDQEEQEAAQVKEEEEELHSSQEEEHFELKQETDTFMVTPTDEVNDKSETEPNSEQHLSHNSADTESQDQGADFPQQLECKEEEDLNEQQLWNQERNSVMEEEPERSQVKEEQEELCISQEGEQLVVKLEADTFMGTLISEEKQHSEAEPSSEQLLSHNFAGTEIQDEDGSRLHFK